MSDWTLQVPEEVIFRHARKITSSVSRAPPGLDDVVEIQQSVPTVRYMNDSNSKSYRLDCFIVNIYVFVLQIVNSITGIF